MLEYLKFDVGGFFCGHRTIKVTNENSELKVIFSDTFSVLDVETSCPDDGWTEKFTALNIDGWKDSYDDLDVLDGIQWGLDYKFQGQDIRHIYGSNDYPENWMDLIDLLEEFHSAIDFMCHDDEDESQEDQWDCRPEPIRIEDLER